MKIFIIFRQLIIAVALTTLISPISLADEVQNAPDTPGSVINLLYRNYAWEAIGDIDGVSIVGQDMPELRRYFTDALAKQIHDSKNIDFDILFDSQDPIVFDLKILPMNKQSEMMISFSSLPDPDKKMIIKFKMVKTDNGWRISDILYSESPHSLRAILNQYK